MASASNIKKIASLSFSQTPNRNQQKQLSRRFHSQQQKNIKEQQKSMREKASLNKLLSTMLQKHNQLNKTTQRHFHWEVILIDQKRTMTGIKVRLKCTQVKSEVYVVVRLSFTLEYLRIGGHVQEGNLFVQLDEINFELGKTEKKFFQTQLQNIMKPMLTRTYYTEDQQESKWVKELLNGVELIFSSNRYQKKHKKAAQLLNRKQIITKYMLYHPPVTFSWSPKGLFCLTQNKVPVSKSSFIGNPQSFKTTIEVPKVSQQDTVNQQELSDTNTQQDQISIFNWDISEEMELFTLTNHKNQLSSYYKDNNRNNRQIQSRKKLTSISSLGNMAKQHSMSGGKTDTVILQYASKLTPTMRKIYQRYFLPRSDFQYELVRGQKLNVYSVLSENRRRQDQMLYIMQKINMQKYKHVTQITLSSMFSSYPQFFTGSQRSSQQTNQLDSAKYFVISEFFKQQRLKLSGCSFDLLSCLKCVIVENQYHAQKIQIYFKECFKMLGVYNPASKYGIYCLGSYLHFDEYKSQKILMRLLQKHERHFQQDQREMKMVIQSRFIQRIKKQIKIKKIVKFPHLNQDWLMTDDIRKQFIQTILPILIVRDRNYEDFYYRQLERIITTNQKIIKFYKNLSNITKKVQQQRRDFIKHLISQYSIYEQQKRLNEPTNNVRRQFTIYCQKCQKPNRTFQISQAQKLRICSKCSQAVTKK